MRLYLLLFLVIILETFCGNSMAQDEPVELLRKKLESFDYQSVISISDSLLNQNNPELHNNQLLNIYELRGIAFYSLSEKDSAQNSFINLLKIDWGYEPDSITVSPKIITFFHEVKKDFNKIMSRNQNTKKAQIDSISLSNPGIIKITKNLFANSVYRSIVLPGWGHIFAGSTTKGWILTSASAVSLGSMVYFIFATNSKEQDYLNAIDPVQIQNKYDVYNSSFKVRNALIITYAVIWLYSQIDLFFFSDDMFSEKINSILLANFSSQSPANLEFSFRLFF